MPVFIFMCTRNSCSLKIRKEWIHDELLKLVNRLLMITDKIKSRIKRKRPKFAQKHNNVIFNMTMLVPVLQSVYKSFWRPLMGCYIPTCRIHRTWFHRISTHFNQFNTDFQNNTCIITKEWKIGLLTVGIKIRTSLLSRNPFFNRRMGDRANDDQYFDC